MRRKIIQGVDAHVLIYSRCMFCFYLLYVEATYIDFLIYYKSSRAVIMRKTFDIDHVLENISEQDKIALLSGNIETVLFGNLLR